MASDGNDLAQRLLDAHVAHVVADLTGPQAAGLVTELVTDVVGALTDTPVGELVDAGEVRATVHALIADVGPSAAIGEMVAVIVPAVHGLEASDDHRLGDVVDRADVEAVVDRLAASTTLREEVMRRLGRSPALAQLSMRFVSALVGDAVEQNRRRAEKVPGVKLALGVGDLAGKTAKRVTPKQVERAIGGAADKGAQAAFDRVSRAIAETLDEQAVRTAVMEVWDLHAADTIGGLRAYVEASELEDVAAAGHRIWVGAHASPWVRAIADLAVDTFFARHEGTTLGELLAEFGLTEQRLGEVAARHAPAIAGALAEAGALDGIVRARLEPFYTSDAVREVLATVS